MCVCVSEQFNSEEDSEEAHVHPSLSHSDERWEAGAPSRGVRSRDAQIVEVEMLAGIGMERS